MPESSTAAAANRVCYVEFSPQGVSFKSVSNNPLALYGSGGLMGQVFDSISMVERNAHVSRCLNTRVDAISRMPFRVEDADGNDVTFERRYEPLFGQMVDLLDHIETSLTLFGAAYCEIAASDDFEAWLLNDFERLPVLVPLEAGSVTPRHDAGTGMLAAFERREAGRIRTIPLDQMFWVWRRNPKNRQMPGPGLAQTALMDGQVLWHLSQHIASWFAQGCNRNIVFLTNSLDEDEMKRLEQDYQDHLAGWQNAHRPFVLGEGVKAMEVGTKLSETASDTVTQQTRENIEFAFGVQGMINPNDANFAVAQVRRLNFYDNVVLPQIERIFAVMNRTWLHPLGLHIVAVPSRLEVYQAAELEKAQALSTLVGRPTLTVNEARELLGKERMPDPRYDLLEPDRVAASPGQTDAQQTSTALEIFGYHGDFVLNGLMTLNELRQGLGLPPVPGGDTLQAADPAAAARSAPDDDLARLETLYAQVQALHAQTRLPRTYEATEE